MYTLHHLISICYSSCGSLLHQLNNALCVHEEHFSFRLLVESSSMAVQDVCNLETRGDNQCKYLIPAAVAERLISI